MEGAHWPVSAIKASIADAVRYVIQVIRHPNGRRVVGELRQVQGYDIQSDHFVARDCLIT
jgi:hypothetical protein